MSDTTHYVLCTDDGEDGKRREINAYPPCETVEDVADHFRILTTRSAASYWAEQVTVRREAVQTLQARCASSVPNAAPNARPLPPPGQPAAPNEGLVPSAEMHALVVALLQDAPNYLKGEHTWYLTRPTCRALLSAVASLEAERDALLKSDIGYWMALAEERRIEIAELRRKAAEKIAPWRGGDTTGREIL